MMMNAEKSISSQYLPEKFFVIVEHNLNVLGGHWSEVVPLLAKAASRRGVRLRVVAPDGIAPETRSNLTWTSAEVIAGAGSFTGAAMLCAWAARLLKATYLGFHGLFPKSRLSYQFLLLSRCFTETAALRYG